MGTTALVMTTGDAGAYLCPVEPGDLPHLLRGPYDSIPLTQDAVALVGTGAAARLPRNEAAEALVHSLRLTPPHPLHGPVVVTGVGPDGRLTELGSGMVSLARRTLAPLDHLLPRAEGPLPRLHAAVQADDHEVVHELLREFPDGRIEVREAYGWFPHAFGLPSGPFASPTVEVTDLVGLEELVGQVDVRSTARRRVHGADEVEDPWGLLASRLAAHLLDPAHRAEEGRTVVRLAHLDPDSGCPRETGRPTLIIAAYEDGHVRLELSGDEHLLPELRPGELALRRLARDGWEVAGPDGSHLLEGDAALLPHHVRRGLEALRTLFAIGSPDHLVVALLVGGRTVRASDRLALLGTLRPLLLTPHRQGAPD